MVVGCWDRRVLEQGLEKEGVCAGTGAGGGGCWNRDWRRRVHGCLGLIANVCCSCCFSGLIGKWHLGLNSKQPNDFVHHPLNHGFQYFYGLPLTNLRDCEPGESVFEHIIPWFRASTIKSAAFVFALLALTLYSVGFIQKKVLGILFFVICLFCACLLLILGGYRVFNCFLMRDFEVVEQPVTLENLTVKFTDEAVTFIQENKHTPFMLFMSFAKVHTALFTTKPFTNHSKHGRYGDNVEEMDWSVGQIMNAIEDLGLKEDTFVYFTSDNGPHLEEVSPDGVYEGGWKGIYRGGKPIPYH